LKLNVDCGRDRIEEGNKIDNYYRRIIREKKKDAFLLKKLPCI